MARDIEEFLRRAAERRKQQKQQQRQPQPPVQPRKARRRVESAEIEVVDPIQVVRTVQGRKPQTNRPSNEQRRSRKERSIADRVRSHIDTSDVTEHIGHLGERIRHADHAIDERIRSRFDRDVSKLDDSPTVQDDEVASVAQVQASQLANDLLAMLSQPESVRQAILVSEILKRPHFD